MKSKFLMIMSLIGCNSGNNGTKPMKNVIETDIFVNSYYQVVDKINTWKNVEDIYAISIWISPIDDDIRMIQAIVGYNTLSQVDKMKSKASNIDEAKWNFAFWLQNEEITIGGNDNNFQNWIKSLPDYYDDNLWSKDMDNAIEKGDRIKDKFVIEIIDISKKLFDNNVIKSKFGKNIPIIIHELEYYDKPLNWTINANPKGLVDDFEKWMKNI